MEFGKATFWKRAIALSLDYLILMFTAGLLNVGAIVLGISTMSSDVAKGLIIIIVSGVLFGLAVPIAYWTYFIGKKGQTLGKEVMGIQVVRMDGLPMTYGLAFFRYLLLVFVGSFTLYLDYLWPLWDEEQQTLHDKIVKTYVIDLNLPLGYQAKLSQYTPSASKYVPSLPSLDKVYPSERRVADISREAHPVASSSHSQVLGWLIGKEGKAIGKSFSITKSALKIGRDSRNDIVIDDSMVSRGHAKIMFKDQKLYILDLGSKNGTAVNGNYITSPIMLLDGDKIQIGSTVLIFKST